MVNIEQYFGKQTWQRVDRPMIEDPEPRPRKYKFISVDDHFVEPANAFLGRMPAALAEHTPRVLEDENGMEYWLIDGKRVTNDGTNAHISWPLQYRYNGPVRFDEIRLGTYDVHARVRDMDIGGVLASLCFPSAVFGFAGQRFSRFEDPAVGLEAMRAYNRWIIEDWTGSYPDRLIPCQVTWLLDPTVAAEEIRRNAEAGFKAVAFTENPERLGLPSIYSSEWDPFFRACEETETVINLHVGSSSQTLIPSLDSPIEVLAALFPVNAFMANVDWLFAKVGVRFPNIRIAMTESGVGWVPMLLDRLGYMRSTFHRDNVGGMGSVWGRDDPTPEEVLHRNFWVTCFWDPIPFQLNGVLPFDRVMFEMDYPHTDSTWPNTQDVIDMHLSRFGEEEIARMTYKNASELYRHPVADAP